MKNMTLERITEVCGGVYYGSEADKKKEIAGAVIDSRQVESGYLFIAVKGEKVDGHQFIPQVFEKGALAVLSEQELSEPAGKPRARTLRRRYGRSFCIPTLSPWI